MSLAILGIGTATPRHQIAQADAAALATRFSHDTPPERTLAAIYRQTRIRSRGSVLLEDPQGEPFAQSFFPPASTAEPEGPGTAARMQRYAAEAGPLAIQAAERALAEAELTPSAVTHLVTCSCTGFSNPGVDIELMTRLGIRPTTSRTHVGFMGCHGGFNALRVADAFSCSVERCVPLIVCVELCSLHFQYGSRSDVIVANSIFADGAAAVTGVGSRDSGATGRWRVRRQWSRLLPESTEAMGWTIGDRGFEMNLSASVPTTIAEHLPALIDAALAEIGLDRGDIDGWAVHPGGPRILAGVEESLRLPSAALAASRDVLADHGNMSSGTIFFILERLLDDRAGRCLAMAFGPGLTVELALFERI